LPPFPATIFESPDTTRPYVRIRAKDSGAVVLNSGINSGWSDPRQFLPKLAAAPTIIQLGGDGTITNIPTGTQRIHVELADDVLGTNVAYPGHSPGGDMIAGDPGVVDDGSGNIISVPIYASPDSTKPYVRVQALSTPSVLLDGSNIINGSSNAGWSQPRQFLPFVGQIQLDGQGNVSGIPDNTAYVLAQFSSQTGGSLVSGDAYRIFNVSAFTATAAATPVKRGTPTNSNPGSKVLTVAAPVVPTGTLVGDLLVMVVELENVTGTTPTVNSSSVPGWDPQGARASQTETGGAASVTIFTKIHDGTAMPTLTWDLAAFPDVTIYAVSGVNQLAPIDSVSGFQINAIGSAAPVPGLTTT
jgi:hypothetical protein